MTSKTTARALRDSSPRLSQPALIALAASATAAAGLAAFNAVQARRATEAHPPLGEFVEVEGTKLHYLAQGSGPTVVLLHGNGTMIEDWIASGVLGALARSHRVIAFDRPGFGHSSRPRTSLWTPFAQATVIAKALAEIGETRVTVAGHSFGTLVALALAAEQPELVGSLVLVAGYYYPSARIDVAFAAPPALPVIGDVIRYTASPLIGAAAQSGMEKQMFAPAPVSVGWHKDFPFEMTLRPGQIRAAAEDAALMIPAAATLAKRRPQPGLPITVIAGRGDLVVDQQSQSARLAEEVEGSELLMVEDAGHMVHHSAMKTVVEAIKASAGRKAQS
jgi:pimeloyl-ACP methyl ester carboxylesterase